MFVLQIIGWGDRKSSIKFNDDVNKNTDARCEGLKNRKKNKNFDQKTDEEKASAMRKILHNLIQRDQDEVDRIEENSFNLSFKIDSDSTFSKVVDSRISGQKRKLEVKKRILNELKKGQVKS